MNQALQLDPINAWDIVISIVVILLMGFIGAVFFGVKMEHFMSAGLVGSMKLSAIPLLGALVIITGIILVRTLEGRGAELFGVGLGAIGALIASSGLQAIPVALNPAENPTIEVNRGTDKDFDIVKIKVLALPEKEKDIGVVSIYVQSIVDVSAKDAKAISPDKPLVVRIPKGAKGEVYYQVDYQPTSLATSF